MLPVQLTIRDIPNSIALDNHVKERAQKFSQYFQPINSCKVVIEHSQKHKRNGKLYSVSIDVKVPGKELVACKENEDAYIAVRDAFNALERQLRKYASRKHDMVKHPEEVSRGTIVRLFPEERYGFIQGFDGNEFYFNAVNVTTPKFEKLVIGDTVSFLGIINTEGPQAHHIAIENHEQHAA